MATEIEVKGVTYQIGRMEMYDQINIGRRVLPLFNGWQLGMARAVQGMTPEELNEPDPPQEPVNGEEVPEAIPFDRSRMAQVEARWLAAVEPVMHVVSQMKDEEVNLILKKCLSVVRKKNADGRWIPVVAGNGKPLFEDELDAMTTIRLAWEVVSENVGPSLSGLNFLGMLGA